MGKKYKKKVQWKQLSLTDILSNPNTEEKEGGGGGVGGDDCEEEEGDSAPQTPTHEDSYSRPPYKPSFNNPRRGGPYHFHNHHYHHHGYYHANYDRRFDKNFDRYNSENFRNLENRGGGVPFEKPYSNAKPFYDRNYHHYDKFYPRPPFYGEHNFKFAGGGGGGYVERGRRPFRPYGPRPGFFPPRGFPGHFGSGGRGPFYECHGKGSSVNGCEGEEDEEEWDEEGILVVNEGQQQLQQQQHHQQKMGEGGGGGSCERPSQPVHTVMINNEEYTKIQTPRQEVIFKKSSLDRKRDSIDQGSVTGSVSSGSGSSSTTGGEHGSGSAGSGDQAHGDGSSVAGSVEDASLSVTGEDPPDMQQQDQVFEDPNEIFAGEPGGPPLAGVVMQQAYPGGPMITIPVHWTPFIDPGLIPGETALTPLDPAFTHVIDPKALPIDPLHILPVQHDASGCPVHVQVKVDSNGVPIQIQPAAFTVSLSSLHQHHDQQGVLSQEDPQLQQDQEPQAEENQPEATLDDQLSSEVQMKEEEKEPQSELEATISSDKNQTEEDDCSPVTPSECEKGVVEETENKSEERPPNKKSLRLKMKKLEDISKANKAEGGDAKVDEIDDMEVPEECHEANARQESSVVASSDTPAAVPSTNPEVKSSTESTSSKGSKRRRGGGRGKRGRQRAQPKEEENQEQILVKETEEGSDSSDSQYASMSESSTTPTTPAGEPSDTHEAPESHPVEIQEEPSKENHPESEQVSADSSMQVSADSSMQVSADSSMHTEEEEEAHQTINNTPIEASTAEESSNSSDNTQDNAESAAGTSQMETSQTSGTSENDQTTPENTSEYPPTTPDTADNVLQGYVMVPILTPYYDPSVLYGYPVVVSDQNQQQHQRSYSKRKKKKYQRRRHADAAAGGYLDPQLYTGEPFVATPGGYVVPVDATTSVCQVHGFQYVSAPYQLHPQPSEEGFIQHPSYLSNIVQDPATQHVLLLGGTNQEDASKALQVFGDLQEKERRQIQEILHEQRARVGKSDSTESSDSGVSESEEAVTTELSCDEQDSQKSNTEESSASDNTEAAKDSITDQCLEAIPGLSSTDEIEPLQSLSQGSVVGDDTSTSNNSVQPQEENLLISHCKEPAEDISNQTDTASASCNSNDNDPDYVAHIADGTFIYPDKEASHSCNLLHPKTDLDADEECTDSLLEDISPAESVLTCDTDTKHIQKISKTDIALATVIAKDHSSGQIDLENRLIAQTETKHKDDADGIQNITKLCEEQGNIQENVFQSEPTTVTHTFPDDLSSQAPHTPHCSATTDKIVPEAFVYQSINELSSEERTSECLHQDSLQDLKVTEAVKRWIREVTPEKAFFLSEEVQTRILEQSIQEEMDSEDEYIEDEIPQSARSTVENPKNVEGNPFVAASSNAPFAGMESCNKRVAASNRQRGNTPDTLDEYDGSSTISNLSSDHLYSEASSSQRASFNQSFEEDYNEKYNENPNMYNPAVYAKYYQLGVEVDETTPSVTPVPQSWQLSRETTPAIQTESETVSECGSEDVETVPHKYDVVCQYTATSPMSLATEILKAEKVLSNMSHITGTHEGAEASGYSYGNPDIYLKHYGTARFIEVGDSGVQSEESSDEMEARSNVGSSGVGSSLASTPAVSPAHRFPGSTPLQSHPLRNLSVGDGPVPCRTVCCAVM